MDTKSFTEAIEKQELHCHGCNRYVQFDLDLNLNGNHVLNCPNCGHEHCRVVKDGKITDDRWDQRNGIQSYIIGSATSTATSTWDAYTGTAGTTRDIFMYQSWVNTTAITT